MMQPTKRPMMTLVDFMIGEPKRSQRMMARKTEKPRPRNSALPQGRAWGASMLGHRAKKSLGSVLEKGPEPPAQLLNPVSTRWTPMSMTVGPVTIGGKILSIVLGGMKEMRISTREQTAQ